MKTVTTFLFSALLCSLEVYKRLICSSFSSYDLLTTNTSSLVDVEVGRNCNFHKNSYRFKAIVIQFLHSAVKYGFSY